MPRSDVTQIPGRLSFHAIQVNKYDPQIWPAPEHHHDSGRAGISWMIDLGRFEGGAFLIQERPVPERPTRITVVNKWILFDGLKMRWSEPVTEGTRYSVIAFSFAGGGS